VRVRKAERIMGRRQGFFPRKAHAGRGSENDEGTGMRTVELKQWPEESEASRCVAILCNLHPYVSHVVGITLFISCR
jgi:hypothetical protein